MLLAPLGGTRWAVLTPTMDVHSVVLILRLLDSGLLFNYEGLC